MVKASILRNYRWLSIIFFIVAAGFSLYFFFNRTEVVNKAKSTYFVQVPLDLRIISTIQQKLEPIIATIIKEEIGEIPKDCPALFFFKKRAAVTVYYLNDMYVGAEPLLFSMLNDTKNELQPACILIELQAAFFGGSSSELMALTDLVIFINDPNKALLLANQEIKKAAGAANAQYKSKYRIDMYDKGKSEQFAYVPHLSLGHLRANYIKHLVQDFTYAEEVVERIKQRIMKAVHQILSELSLEERRLCFGELNIYDLQKRAYIKQYKLGKPKFSDEL